MLESAEQNFKFESNEDFGKKCKDPQQKDGIINFLHTGDSYFCDLKIDAESIEQVKDRDIKIQLILRLDEDNFKKVVNKLQKEHFQKLIKNDNNKKDVETEEEKDDDEKINFEESTLTSDYLFSYFANKDFNEFSSPMEIFWFLQKCAFLNNDYRLISLEYFENNFKKLFVEKNFDIHNYFYTNRKNWIKIMQPKQEFFDLCVEKNLNAWATYAFACLPRSKQTKENFLKVPKEFQVSALASLRYGSWKLIDCLSKDQKQELVDKKIITEKDFLNKKDKTIRTTVEAIFSAIALAGLIASCIFLSVVIPTWPLIFSIAGCAFCIIFGIGATIVLGRNLYKINKFNKEIAQSETATPANNTNNPNIAVEAENENTQKNDLQNQTEHQPPMGNNPNQKEPE